jgi:hypothetical protein
VTALRIILAAALLGAAWLALSAQRFGGGGLAAQIAYLVALVLFVADRVMTVRRGEITDGRATIQVAVGALIATVIFAPDFGAAIRRRTPGISPAALVQLAASEDPDKRRMALELCLRRRAFRACKPAFAAAVSSTDPVTKNLGQAGILGRSGLHKK